MYAMYENIYALYIIMYMLHIELAISCQGLLSIGTDKVDYLSDYIDKCSGITNGTCDCSFTSFSYKLDKYTLCKWNMNIYR